MKKLFIILSIVIIIFSLTACSDNLSSSNQTLNSNNNSTIDDTSKVYTSNSAEFSITYEEKYTPTEEQLEKDESNAELLLIDSNSSATFTLRAAENVGGVISISSTKEEYIKALSKKNKDAEVLSYNTDKINGVDVLITSYKVSDITYHQYNYYTNNTIVFITYTTNANTKSDVLQEFEETAKSLIF